MEVFDALAQPKRREILRQLAPGEMSAGEVASRFSVTQPAISQHLKVLKQAGLVKERRDGARRMYSVRPEGLADLHRFLSQGAVGRPGPVQAVSQKGGKGKRWSRAKLALSNTR